MRISTNQLYQNGINAIGRQQSELLSVYQQISSGRRMVTPADDPLAAAQAINISQSKSLSERLAANRNTALQNLSIEESVLNNITQRYQEIKQRLVEAGNGTLSDIDRQTLGEVFSNLKDNLLALANSTDGTGQFLFSGYQGDSAPFIVGADGSVQWTGDQGKRLIQVDTTRQISTSDDGKSIFMTATGSSRSYFTKSATSNTGSGVISSPSVTDPNGQYVGKNFEIEFAGDPLEYVVHVRDKDGTLLETTTPAAWDGKASSIQLPGGVRVDFSGQPEAGDTFEVRYVQGEDINVFNTLDQVIAALNTPISNDPKAEAQFRNAMATALQLVEENYNTVLTVRSSVGSRMNEIETLNDAGVQQVLSYESELSRLEGLDLYTATIDLNLKLAGLEAASAAFKKIQGLSLFTMNGS